MCYPSGQFLLNLFFDTIPLFGNQCPYSPDGRSGVTPLSKIAREPFIFLETGNVTFYTDGSFTTAGGVLANVCYRRADVYLIYSSFWFSTPFLSSETSAPTLRTASQASLLSLGSLENHSSFWLPAMLLSTHPAPSSKP